MGNCCDARPPDEAKPRSRRPSREAGERRSQETVDRHLAASGTDPNLLCYYLLDLPGDPGFEISDSQSQCHPRADGPRARACHVPPNTKTPVPFETSGFAGQTLWMQRPVNTVDAQNSPYSAHFSGRKRRWEFRLQGKFKRSPTGEMYIGVVIRDFNYDQPVALHSQAVKWAGLRLVNHIYETYLTMGSRCKESFNKDGELGHMVTSMAGWDQVIVTPPGQTPPAMTEDISDQGFLRSKLGIRKFTAEMNHVFNNIDLDSTYTLSFWGVAQFMDVLNWQFDFVGMTTDMNMLFEDSPVHVSMYEIVPERKTHQNEKRHLEYMKVYYVDVMFWSNTANVRQLSARYEFLDAPADIEEEGKSIISTLSGVSVGTLVKRKNGAAPPRSHMGTIMTIFVFFVALAIFLGYGDRVLAWR